MTTRLINQTDHYTYRITWSDEDSEYVGLCAEFPSLSWLDKTQEAALQGIRNLVAKVVSDMKSNDENIPEPLAIKQYSGKLLVRIPPNVHRDLTIQAAEAKVSINRLISSKLSSIS
jgi:predicted HicB family RNase H-like nuclease